jgi:cobalamin biosynthesis protein CobW
MNGIMMQPKVPVTIVTGFLGAGKTTLIRHTLENAKGRRLALIINEFGDLGVDGAILKGCGISSCPEENIVELTNGCLCCTVADDFVPTLDALLSRGSRPDHIIIETSGLALPKPLVKAFDWPDIRARATVDGVVTMVDGPAVAAGRFADDLAALARQREADPSLDHENPLEEVFEDQLLAADLVILNKIDQLTPDGIKAVEAQIEAVLPRAVKLVRTQHGAIPVEVLLGLDAAAEDDLQARPSHHDNEDGHDHDDFESFVAEISALSTPSILAERVTRAAAEHNVLRVKGYAHIEGKPLRLLVQGVGGRIETRFERPWEPGTPPRGALAVIGLKGFDRESVARILRGDA